MDASPTLNIGLDTQPEDDFDRHLDQLGEVGQNKHDDDSLEQALEVLMEAEYGAVQDSDRKSHQSESVPGCPGTDVDIGQGNEGDPTAPENARDTEPAHVHMNMNYSSHIFPPPPSNKHPDLNCILESAAKACGFKDIPT